MKRYTPDILQGPLLPSIIRYTVPIILTSVLQLLFNAVDLIVVGRYCGSECIAAVSATGSLTNLFVCLFMGLSVGVSVCVAHAIGAGQEDSVHKTVHTAVPLAVICGLVVTVLGVIFSSSMLELMQTPEDVLPLSSLYMQIFFGGMVFNLLYNFAAAILRAAGDTRGPLIYLTIAGAANAVLNVLFITLFGMSVDGVALATVISQAISAVLTVAALMRRTDGCRLILKEIKLYKEPLLKILRIGLPTGIQSGLFSISNVIIQSSVNSFNNTVLMSGFGAAGNIEGFLYVSMNAFSSTSTTYVGQNYGARQFSRIKRATITCLVCVTVVGSLLGSLIYLFGRPLLSIYISDSPEAIEYGMIRFACLCIPYFTCGMMDVLTGSIRGLGASFVPMIITILGACGLRILWVYTIFQIPQYHTPTGLYLSYPVTWTVTFLILLVAFFIIYKRASHKHQALSA